MSGEKVNKFFAALFVDSATIGTAAFGVYLLAAVATDIGRTYVVDVLIDGKGDVSQEQEVTKDRTGDGREEQIIERAHAKQAQQIDNGAQGFEMVQGVVDRGDGEHQYHPHQPQEECQREGMHQRVEQRMEIEVPPHLRVVQLYV